MQRLCLAVRMNRARELSGVWYRRRSKSHVKDDDGHRVSDAKACLPYHGMRIGKAVGSSDWKTRFLYESACTGRSRQSFVDSAGQRREWRELLIEHYSLPCPSTVEKGRDAAAKSQGRLWWFGMADACRTTCARTGRMGQTSMLSCTS